jgi:2-succinyl-5-enolpyruvyl-6-hydroxy-3-cyclohexene-1-carboxylate synthase
MSETGAQNQAAATALVDAFVAAGVRHAVVAPGSRSGPLAVACARSEGLALHVVLDERSAAFRALGIGRATAVPALLACTSGSAATHFHPAVVEAFHGRVPLVVCTANRPPELQGVGAPQTIDQRELYGRAVRLFAEPGPPDDEPAPDWAALATTAYAVATGVPAGPVQLDLAFREPLLAS